MHDLIRPLRHWADHSAGGGMLARRLQRFVRQVAYQRHRAGNMAMLHAGRCGSSVLADLLNQHPDVRWANEPFENMKPAYYRMSSAHRARQVIADRMYRERSRYFGFDSKVLPEQHLAPALANKDPADYVALLRELGFGHFILLERRNYLRQAVSIAIGGVTGQWNTLGQPVPTPVVHLDPARFVSYGREMPLLEFFASLDRRFAELRRLLQPRERLDLVYEDDIEADPRVGYAKVCGFLGIVEQPVSVRLKRLNPHPIRAMVANFDELRATLQGTRYEWMLEA